LGITLRKDPESGLAPTSAPTLSPEALSDLLASLSSDKGEALSTSSTPQSKAFNWLVTNNTNLGTFSKELIIQRYALATLFFSTNGDSWFNNAFWLDSDEECSKWGVSCTNTSSVSQLDFEFNNLHGAIPPEIGLLTSLGKCVLVFGCHNVLAQSLRASICIHLVILMVCFNCLCSFSFFKEQHLNWTNPK
jgi:hypothetical protein